MGQTPFSTDHRPEIGAVERLDDDLCVVTAPNASPMTFTGTRSYILGRKEVVIIDPGPDDPAHRAAILSAVGARTVAAILVTHGHLDHTPLATGLHQETGAPIHAFKAPVLGQNGATLGADLVGGEGVDAQFSPQIELSDGQTLSGTGWEVNVIHTPGHLNDHVCFASNGRLFSGDHVMGWATTMISPPQGDLNDFMASLHKVIARDERRYFPGHGAPIDDGKAVAKHILAHRTAREAQIVASLKERPAKLADLTATIYHDVDPRLHRAASRNVLSHLLALAGRGALVQTHIEVDTVVALRR